MTNRSRFTAPAPLMALLVMLLLAACGSQAVPSPSPSVPPAPPAPGDPEAARDAYSAAICPIFGSILELDPRLVAMRDAGAQGGDMSVHATEIGEIGDELLMLLNALERVPDWSSGANLRYELITALHAIHAQLLRIGGDPGAAGAAEELASLPFIASEAMDRAMQDAVGGGLSCEGAS